MPSRARLTVGQLITLLPLLTVFVVLPVWFFPLTQDPFDTSKFYLLTACAGMAFLTWIFAGVRHGKLSLTASWNSLFLLGVTLAALASTLISASNRTESLLSAYGPLPFFCLLLLSVCHTADWSHYRKTVRTALTAVGGITGIFAVYQALNLGKILLPGSVSLSDPLWTPLGSPLALLIFLAVIAPLAADTLVTGIRHRQEKQAAVGAVLLLGVAAGFFVTLIQYVPKVSTAFLPYQAGLQIILQGLKDPKTAVFGVGPEAFMAAFTAGRPAYLNMTALWNVRFSTNASFLLHMVSVTGLLGGLTFLAYALSLLPTRLTPSHFSRALVVIAFLILPPVFPLLVLSLAIRFVTDDRPEAARTLAIPLNPLLRIIAVLVMLISLGGLFLLGRTYAAELVYYQAVKPTAEVNGTNVYNLQIQAIKLNPAASRFRAAYSQTNLALASAIANANADPQATPGAQLAQLSEQDRQVVTQLIQQAIREAKATANLAPRNVAAWENLGLIYQNLFGIADGADKWAIAAFQQAIALDPSNPLLRQSLGALYAIQQNYDTAITHFNAAIELKPDFANAYYNLANAYRMKGDAPRAIAELERTLQLLKPGTSDYVKATNELEELRQAMK